MSYFLPEEKAHHLTKNAQGDITGIIDLWAQEVAKYTYDSWGNVAVITDGDGNDVSGNAGHIANQNPLRYRGYYFDKETGYYYLQSRYYDPEWGRFINGDALLDSGHELLGHNLFAYCNNDPVNCVDSDGMLPRYFNNYILKTAKSRLAWYTRAKSINSERTALNTIYRYDYYIRTYAKRFGIFKEMVQAVLFREIICEGYDDLVADDWVRRGWRSDSSTGLGQIFAATAIAAERSVLGYNTTKNKRTMWNKLQNKVTNIYYTAMVLKYYSRGIRLSRSNQSGIMSVFTKYNGSSSYGREVLRYYLAFCS